ncbi:MAG: signal peptidase I [bacterium]
MKIGKILLTLTQVLLVGGLLVVAVLTFGSKIPFLSRLGINFFYVVSGSMEPTIPTGALIYSGKYKLEELKKDDIITFNLRDEKSGAVSIVTHRIDSLEKVEGMKGDKKTLTYNIITKGDANNTTDPRNIPPGNIIGLYRWYLPYLGYVTSFAQTVKGFILLVILPATILIIWEIIDLVLYFKNYYEKKYKAKNEK